MRKLFCVIMMVGIPGYWGCGGSDKIPAYMTVQKGTFEIVVPGFGELDAVKSTPIMSPSRGWSRQTIAWMAPENSVVKAGETVIRLDSKSYIDNIKTENINIAKLDLEIRDKERNLSKEKKDLQAQLTLTEIEKQLAEIYKLKDEEVYSRNEIISSSINVEFLETKARYLRDKTKQLEQKTSAELQLLISKRKTLQVKVEQFQGALDSLEIKAPHDGLLIYEKIWRGDKPRLGMSIYPGMKLAKLPDLGRMEAKAFVLESEAAGLKENLPAVITLDSSPGMFFNGKVTGLDTIAKPVVEDSPLKYFEVKVSLEKTVREMMKPGSQVKVSIFVRKLDNALTVPNQALSFQEGKSFLNVVKSGGSRIEKREVKTGDRSLTRTVITAGLSEGEKVAL